MDITTVGATSSHDALFAEMMGVGGGGEQPAPQARLPLKVEKRSKKRRDGPKQQRPVSMTTFSSSPAHHPRLGNLQQQTEFAAERGSSVSLRACGMAFPFSKPKAFFSSEQHLPAKVESYNKSREGLFQLRASEEDIYSGLLKFHYFDGLDNYTDNLPVQTSTTVSDLLPELITRFLPHEYQLDAVDGNHPSSVALVQGQMERVLDREERPLEIALDCSSQGLASPKFVFKSSLPASNGPPLTPRRSSCFAGSSRSMEDNYSLDISQPEHYSSMTSLTSGVSLASSKSAKSKSNSSLTGRGGKKKIHQTLSNQELIAASGAGPGAVGASPSSTASPSHRRSSKTQQGQQQQQDTSTPGSGRKISRSKAAVTNFITRSLRVRKRSKQQQQQQQQHQASATPDISPINSQNQDSNEEEEDEEELNNDIPLTNSLISPRIPAERKFTLSTVMHIYFTEGKQAQVYKSVLVSERATSLEVIAQALERYNMKGRDPQDYCLFDVIGNWRDVTHTLPTWKIGNSTLPNMNVLNASPLIQRRTSVEEFVVCYCRQLGPHESPYNAQFYLTTQEGFTRRFELRSKSSPDPGRAAMGSAISHEKSHSVDIMERPDEVTPTPADALGGMGVASSSGGAGPEEKEDEFGIFGKTTHRKRAKRNRIGNQSVDSADPDVEITIFGPNSVTKASPLLNRMEARLEAGLGPEEEEEDEDEEEEELGRRGHGGGVVRERKSGGSGHGSNRQHRGKGGGVVGGVSNNNSSSARDDQDLEIPISMTSGRHAPDFSALMCSSPDSGVEFHNKHSAHHQRHHHHHQGDSTKSSVSSEQSERSESSSSSSAIALYPAGLGSAYLLSLHLQDPSKEHLVHKLVSDTTELGTFLAPPPPSQDGAKSPPSSLHSPLERIPLLSLDAAEATPPDAPLCCVCRQPVAAEDPGTGRRRFRYTLRKTEPRFPVSVNGEEVPSGSGSAASPDITLSHGDIIAVGDTYYFMFCDYDSIDGDSHPRFNWKLCPVADTPTASPRPARTSASVETITDQEAKRKKSGARDLETVGVTTSSSSGNGRSSYKASRETGKASEGGGGGGGSIGGSVVVRGSPVISQGSRLAPSSAHSPAHSPALPHHHPPPSPHHHNRKKHSTASDREQRASGGKSRHDHAPLGKTRSLPLPTDRKLVFSFKPGEEDTLLSHVVSTTRDGLGASRCKLAAAYILSMCTEYCVMSGSGNATARFVRKATDRIQEVVWEFTRRLSAWEPSPEMPDKPLQQMKELFPLLEPVLFWLGNTLEYYNFLHAHEASLHLSSATAGADSALPGKQGSSDDPLSTLHNILVYAYQQAFYPVSKVLYNSLPLMLESCVEEVEGRGGGGGGGKPIVVGEAVEFLQALLDMMNDQQLHLEVVFQFYANIFFFVNAAMFNALLEQGGELGLYQYYSGKVLRANLSLLEGWACQVGFKDSVLHYLAKFSGAVDLLATPTNKLLQLNWSDLCHEFPVLHPAQLHFLLSQYLLPSSITELPRHWTPSKEDAIHALSGKSLQESFDNHPGFTLPASGYTLDLTRPPPESDHFRDSLEKLRSSLNHTHHHHHAHHHSHHHHRNHKRDGRGAEPPSSSSSSAGPPVKVQSIRVSVQDGVSSLKRNFEDGSCNNDESDLVNGYMGRPRGHIGSNTESQEDLTTSTPSSSSSSHRNRRNLESHSNGREDGHGSWRNHDAIIMDSVPYQNGIGSPGTVNSERVDRVRTVAGARSFRTPEKLILETDDPGVRVHPSRYGAESSGGGGAWKSRFPRGSRTVTVPRGDKGFGFIMVEKKDPVTQEPTIVVQQVLPGTTAAQCQQLQAGDQILAIDEQLLDGADYLIADKYVKEAEDDVTLTLAPRQST